MKSIGSQLKRSPILLILAMACLCATALLYSKLLAVEHKIATAIHLPAFTDIAEQQKEVVNSYIEQRINAYVLAQKQERVDAKYAAYASAPKETPQGNHIYGELNARFTLVEFSDLECPYCKKFHSSPKDVVDASSGLVNWQWKHMPLAFHDPIATLQAHASECVADIAGNRAFWVYLQQIFDETRGNGQGAGDLLALARGAGVDEASFAACVEQGKHREQVAADIALAKGMGVNSTPVTFIVDNQTGRQVMLKGLQAPETIASSIQRMKKASDALSMRDTRE
jgi:protein-disulfide isomerase